MISGHTKSCGCYKAELSAERGKNSAIDLTNKRIGKLVAIRPTNRRQGTSIIWKCKCDCGNTAYVSEGDLNKKDFPTMSCGCTQSRGETIIKLLLSELNILFESQKTFDTCINPDTNRKLFFDFYLPTYNILIEYDGIQHFEPSKNLSSWNTKEKVIETQKRDNIKNQWCKNNNIPLIRISYKDFKNINKDFLLERINNYEQYSVT